MSVIGSAATITQLIGTCRAAMACFTPFTKKSALAKNSGASKR